MRGSVYYQSSQLVKQIFQEGVKKEDKVNANHLHYQFVLSYQTMESYRSVWNNFFNYLLEHWKLKDFEKIEDYHIQAYMDYKVELAPLYASLIPNGAVTCEKDLITGEYKGYYRSVNETIPYSI